jgi:hypothetical protein
MDLLAPLPFHRDKQLFCRIDKARLLEALNDHRLPESFLIEPTANYPGLAISTDDDEVWYLGYIDLFTGEIVLNPERGMHDGKNPHDVAQDEDGAVFFAIYSDDWTGPKVSDTFE